MTRTRSLLPTAALLATLIATLAGCAGPETQGGADTAALELRVEPFTVPPSTGPVTHVVARNAGGRAWSGALELRLPEGWRASPERRTVTLQPGEVRRVPFTLQSAVDLESNSYSVEVIAIGDAHRAARKQEIFCASAPYSTPTIDGSLEEWQDSIPVSFEVEGWRTVVRTYWSQRELFIAVEVDEERLLGTGGVGEDGALDALQVAIASGGVSPGARSEDAAARFELLLLSETAGGGAGKCFLLTTPETPLREVESPRELAPLLLEGARVAVSRAGKTTTYECSVPFALLRSVVRPTVGREFQFSLLVHDPDGTGIRDLGHAAGLWPSDRDRLAWSSWRGARWEGESRLEGRVEWGLCSSKH